MELLEGLLRGTQQARHVASLRIPVDPVPTPRPRVGRHGVFYPKNYRDWRDAVKRHLGEGYTNLTGPILLVVEQVKQSPKSSKLTHPGPDIDNFVKAPMDALTRVGGWWTDDKQVVYLIAHKRWTRVDETPHTAIELYEIDEDTRP